MQSFWLIHRFLAWKLLQFSGRLRRTFTKTIVFAWENSAKNSRNTSAWLSLGWKLSNWGSNHGCDPQNPPSSPMEDRWLVPQINKFMTRKSFIGFTIAAVCRRGFSLSGLSKISQRLRRESWGFRMCTANWMNGICGQNPRSKRMETRSWGFEDTFQEFGSRRVNILGIWID